MIVFRALFNGIAGLAVFFALAAGADRLLRQSGFSDSIFFTLPLLLGGLAASAVLFWLSRIQREAIHLSIPRLILQNAFSVILIALCVAWFLTGRTS